jgi:gliding motility-associated-like protein
VRDKLEIYIPNSFTPNGDKTNDTLFVKGVGIQEFKFRIYNRWGELVFETDRLDKGWDGTFRGEYAPEGVYIYTVSVKGFRENRTMKGDVILLR